VSGEDFFARWSRRKRTVRQAEEPERTSPEPAGTGPDAAEPTAGAQEPAGPPDPALSPEEIARHPSVDALTPEADISAFLRKGVPETLRNAALRRMWVLDPAIRDHVGDARDYAWDWNTPGGVPGHGPLAPTDEAYATLERMFTAPERDGPGIGAEEPARNVEDGPQMTMADEQDPVSTPAGLGVAPRQPSRQPEGDPGASGECRSLDGEDTSTGEPEPRRDTLTQGRRRHGSATPD
jgi:hypothetical protein